MSSSSRKEHDSLFLNTIKKTYLEYEQLEISTEKFRILSDKLYQTWMRPQTSPNLNHRNQEGYYVVEYLEQLILENKMNDNFFILIINTLAKNENFCRLFLNDQKRFKHLFNSSIRKAVYLTRYLELLYYYCPLDLISTVGREFYRFIVENYLMKYLRQTSNDIDWIAAFSTLIYQFYENTKNLTTVEFIFTNPKDAIDYSIYVINTLLHHHLKIKVNKDLIYDVKLVNTITKAIGAVWEQYPIKENQDGLTSVQVRSYEYLFDSMSILKSPPTHVSTSHDHSKTTFSSAILPLFPHIQLDTADITLRAMFSDGRLNSERFTIMIKCLIELIDAPVQLIQHMPYETWVIGLCTALVTFKQHEDLRKIIEETTPFLIDHLFNLQTYDNALQILFWFVRYDKRIETFRLIVDRLPKLFEQLKITHNDDLKTRMIELCHMGVAIHPEIDISNEIILKQIIYSLPQPDLNILSNHRAAHARLHSIVSENDKKIPNRLGIINLGNTCYVNSVLQALYQCDLFRKYMLECRFNEQIVLRELQMIFAQLNLSKRPYINAINLVKIARPAWFTIHEQQDCAEFLGLLFQY